MGTKLEPKYQEVRILGGHLGNWLPQSPSAHFTDEETEAQNLDLRHITLKWWSWDSSPGLTDLETKFVLTILTSGAGS